ncbi:TrmB family transcriptional regulator [Halobium palmae]|uniref:TrmB family transcriptional regulator n=1 Tax=Halobium palmae TaxID=1776492 RepID=A0ABD5RVT9_9EURY
MNRDSEAELFEALELTEYEQTTLQALLRLGRTTAPSLAEATGVPKARIYGVLESLADQGYVKIVPERPKRYVPKPPEEILDRATENRRQEFESFRSSVDEVRDEFLSTFGPLYEQASDELTPTEELFHVVDVGEPSEEETRMLYREADQHLHIMTKSFEYLPSVAPTLGEVSEDVEVRILFLHPEHLSESNRAVQRERLDELREVRPEAGVRFSEQLLPWRGTFVDPSLDYDSGKAVLLVEERDVPLHMRQAAITENESFVAGLERLFDLTWRYESATEYPD